MIGSSGSLNKVSVRRLPRERRSWDPFGSEKKKTCSTEQGDHQPSYGLAVLGLYKVVSSSQLVGGERGLMRGRTNVLELSGCWNDSRELEEVMEKVASCWVKSKEGHEGRVQAVESEEGSSPRVSRKLL